MKWPRGIVSAGVACGIKGSGALDLGLLVAAGPAGDPVTWAGTFTQNGAAAACVGWNKDKLAGRVKALVANSGNANACTGAAGQQAVIATAEAAAKQVGCSPDEVLVASTGPIGIRLDPSLIESALPLAHDSLSPHPGDLARAIMTTDTYPKVAAAGAGSATVCGVAKGAAMLAPNMATMLAFVATDASCDGSLLQSALSDAVEATFNRLCLDACESTNDTVLAFASGNGPVASERDLRTALKEVCADLAGKIARDAEGGTKLIRLRVSGAGSEAQAVALGRAVAASDLWRAAAHGEDPNWGRILSAIGSELRPLDLSEVGVAIGGEVLFAKGEPTGSIASAAAAMRSNEFTVECVVGAGEGSAEVLTADLSEEYVTLNAETTT